MDPHSVLALCHEHADAEAAFDIDRVLATLVPEPLYEFYPAGRVLSGWTNIERFYRSKYPVFASQVVDFDLLGEWVNERTAVQEYVIVVRGESGHSDASSAVDDAGGRGRRIARGRAAVLRRGLRALLAGPVLRGDAGGRSGRIGLTGALSACWCPLTSRLHVFMGLPRAEDRTTPSAPPDPAEDVRTAASGAGALIGAVRVRQAAT